MVERFERGGKTGYLRQGEILSGLPVLTVPVEFGATLNLSQSPNLRIEPVIHPYVIVVSPECDLLSDYEERSKPQKEQRRGPKIPDILFCDLYPRSELLDSAGINSGMWKRITSNQHSRFQHLPALEQGDHVLLPELAADFQSVFGVPSALMYSLLNEAGVERLATLAEPYRRQLIHRLSYWMGRVDVP